MTYCEQEDNVTYVCIEYIFVYVKGRLRLLSMEQLRLAKKL